MHLLNALTTVISHLRTFVKWFKWFQETSFVLCLTTSLNSSKIIYSASTDLLYYLLCPNEEVMMDEHLERTGQNTFSKRLIHIQRHRYSKPAVFSMFVRHQAHVLEKSILKVTWQHASSQLKQCKPPTACLECICHR